MKTMNFLLAATGMLSAATALATPAQTPHASLQHDFGALSSGFTHSFTDAMGGTNYHAYYFSLPTDIEHANGSYLSIRTRFDSPFDFGFGVDTVIGLYDASGQKIVDDDEGNTIDEDGNPDVQTPEETVRENFSMLTFGNSDPFGENPDATPEAKRPGMDGLLPAGTYTLVVFPYDDTLDTPMTIGVGGHASLPSTLGALDGFGALGGGNLGGDYGDYSVRIAFQTPTFEPGDFDMNGVINNLDIDLLAANDGNTTDSKFDLDGDGTATFAYHASGITSDSDELIRNVLNTEYGDANLSGNVSIGDLSLLAQHFGQNGIGWRDGDFNGDGRASIGDLSILAQKFGFSSATVAAVPEPSCAVLALVALLAAMHFRRCPRHSP